MKVSLSPCLSPRSFPRLVVRSTLVAFLGGFLALFNACAVTESSIEDVGTQFEQGLQGRGRIVPNDPTTDAFGPVYQ